MSKRSSLIQKSIVQGPTRSSTLDKILNRQRSNARGGTHPTVLLIVLLVVFRRQYLRQRTRRPANGMISACICSGRSGTGIERQDFGRIEAFKERLGGLEGCVHSRLTEGCGCSLQRSTRSIILLKSHLIVKIKFVFRCRIWIGFSSRRSMRQVGRRRGVFTNPRQGFHDGVRHTLSLRLMVILPSDGVFFLTRGAGTLLACALTSGSCMVIIMNGDLTWVL